MTTICYHHKTRQIAVDSRITCGGLIRTDNFNKIIRNELGIWIISGAISDYDAFVEMIKYETQKNNIVLDCSAFLIRDDKVFASFIDDDKIFYQAEITYDYAFGSGRDFAYSALDHGKSAKSAVEYAMTRDIYTGGKVQVIDVKTGKVIS